VPAAGAQRNVERHPVGRRHEARIALGAAFGKNVASPRSCYLFQSDASRKKPEVREFLAWLVAEAAASSGMR